MLNRIIFLILLVTLMNEPLKSSAGILRIKNCYGLYCPPPTKTCRRLITNDDIDSKILISRISCHDYLGRDLRNVLEETENPSGILIHMISSYAIYDDVGKDYQQNAGILEKLVEDGVEEVAHYAHDNA